MSKLQQLIDELCPDGVNFMLIDEVCYIENTKRRAVKSSDRNEGEYPYYGANNIQSMIDGYTHDGEYILVAEDGSASLECYSVQFARGKFWANNHVHVLKSKGNLLNKFIYYYLQIVNFKSYLTGGERAKLTKAKLCQISLPIPPLEIQEEIVRILDNFTELTAELTAELETRKKQYEYYKEHFLSQDFCCEMSNCTKIGNIKKLKLKDITLITSNINWRDNSNKYQYIDLSSVSRDTNQIEVTLPIDFTSAPSRAKQIIKENDVIIGTTRPLLKRYAMVNSEYDEQICSTGYCVLRANEDIVHPKWILYNVTTTAFYQYVEDNQQGTGYPMIPNKAIMEYEIIVPPLDVQHYIVEKLDVFRGVTTDINSGLPAEIENRTKQYAYYRDIILNFKETTNE